MGVWDQSKAFYVFMHYTLVDSKKHFLHRFIRRGFPAMLQPFWEDFPIVKLALRKNKPKTKKIQRREAYMYMHMCI